MKKVVFGVALSAAVMLFASLNAASAAVCGNVDYTLTQDGTTLTPICGSPNEEGASQYAPVNGWSLADTYGGGPATTSGADLTLTGQNWSVTNSGMFPELAIALKQGNGFAFYELNLTAALSGMWSTAGPGNSTNDYSHINLWVRGNPTTPVPLPAAGWMLLAGLGGLTLMRRKS